MYFAFNHEKTHNKSIHNITSIEHRYKHIIICIATQIKLYTILNIFSKRKNKFMYGTHNLYNIVLTLYLHQMQKFHIIHAFLREISK